MNITIETYTTKYTNPNHCPTVKFLKNFELMIKPFFLCCQQFVNFTQYQSRLFFPQRYCILIYPNGYTGAHWSFGYDVKKFLIFLKEL